MSFYKGAADPVAGGPFRLPNVMAHFKRMQERPSVKQLLAYEKEVNEGFARTVEASCATTRSC